MRKRRRRRESSKSPKVGELADIENSRKLKTLGATGGRSRGAAGDLEEVGKRGKFPEPGSPEISAALIPRAR
jgi:hypothetical protein